MDGGEPGTGRQSGLLAVLHRLALTTIGLLHTRLEFIATELEEERNRILGLLLLVAAAGFFLAFGVILLTFFLIVLVWDPHHVLAASPLTAAYLLAGVIFAVTARDAAKAQAKLFAVTLVELRKDRAKFSQ